MNLLRIFNGMFISPAKLPVEDLVRPHVVDTSLDEGYRAMAADKAREVEAIEWSNALAKNMADAAQ